MTTTPLDQILTPATMEEAAALFDEYPDAILLEESLDYPGNFTAVPLTGEEGFVASHGQFVSPRCLLNDPFLLAPFVTQMGQEGRVVIASPEVHDSLERIRTWAQPWQPEGFGGTLYPYQQFSLRRAIERVEEQGWQKDGFFFNWGTGSGKSIAAAAGVQELLVNRGEVDLVLVFTMRTMKRNLARHIEQFAQATTHVIDGTKAQRRKRYQETTSKVWVLNYEKARVDYEELEAAIRDKSVLFIFDEVSKILRGENARNKSRVGMDKLMKRTSRSVIWPMSASVVSHSPFRYHDTFELMNTHNPLGTRKDFAERYCEDIRTFMLRGRIPITDYKWSMDALSEVRHRVVDQVQTLRKTDPGVRENFKSMTTEVIKVQLSREEQYLMDAVMDDAEEQAELLKDEFTITEHYMALRFISNTAEGLPQSGSQAVQRIVDKVGLDTIERTQSTKFEMVADLIEEIQEQGDQVVVFTHWTHMSLFPLSKLLQKRKLKHVIHYGTGMSDKEAQKAQDTFKADPSITAFVSSDAGAMGLNFQNARYVIMVESPYDYDLFMQRRDRIDRADSYLDGLTCYVFVAEHKVEERIWDTMNKRRLISSMVQGTVEDLSRLDPEEIRQAEMSENQFAHHLLTSSSEVQA